MEGLKTTIFSDLLEASAHRFQNSGIGFVLVEHGGTVSNSRR
jgi:hypothetical protein